MVKFVYPYMEKLAQGEELRMSLRSLCKHVKFDFDVVIVGDKPSWYNGLHIQTGQVRGMRFAKCFDITQKILHILESDLVDEEFIYMYDDIYMVSDVEFSDFDKVVAMEKYDPRKKIRGASHVWQTIYDNTFRELNLPVMYNYETHMPRLLKKKLLKLIVSSYDMQRVPVLFNSLYFNEFYEKPDVVLTEKNKTKAGVYSVMTFNQIKEKCAGKKFLNHSENAYNDNMRRFLRESFQEKSKFEL